MNKKKQTKKQIHLRIPLGLDIKIDEIVSLGFFESRNELIVEVLKSFVHSEKGKEDLYVLKKKYDEKVEEIKKKEMEANVIKMKIRQIEKEYKKKQEMRNKEENKMRSHVAKELQEVIARADI